MFKYYLDASPSEVRRDLMLGGALVLICTTLLFGSYFLITNQLEATNEYTVVASKTDKKGYIIIKDNGTSTITDTDAIVVEVPAKKNKKAETKAEEVETVTKAEEVADTDKESVAEENKESATEENKNTDETEKVSKEKVVKQLEESAVADIANVVGEDTAEQELAKESMLKVRCTGYCDNGLTASGAWTTHGIAAGKREWLGKSAEIYKINSDGTVGELIKTVKFADTGAGIDTDGDGKGDTLKTGKSIDVWYPTEHECYSFSAKYGDYVYIKII